MSVLRLKPHILQYKVITEGYEDENGDYHEGREYWEGNIRCDAVPVSGKSNDIRFEDGTARKYTHEVVLDANVRDFRLGETVRIHMLGGICREFDVKGFQRWQLQCKIWV